MPSPSKPSDPILKSGDKAPDFRLPTDCGEWLSLANFAGSKLALFLFPRADTPGCTKEAQEFSHLRPHFAASGTHVIGLSADPERKLARLWARRELSIVLLSDEAHEVLRAYGAWGEKVLYGKRFEGVLRTTFLIGRDGHIAQIWRNVRVAGHAGAVLKAAQALY